ncbi:polysaccharide deacetylase family protein [Ruminiclostridium cellobioparum]|uniref:Polysaccharide deacetylase n=1 Tax=Ruminiclostridium cellobioparum subsp. termitidis CT1112 TaxID=1195236 RepID=S0FMJ1_RUMCE|nr:polysaccharide deacetylase family protein [Ruminiclostridium cellobioparum]EMS69713.1 Polysaccharide deacetylase [Ruminiclostridium cellobioparum subsp. termitidis CT1112]
MRKVCSVLFVLTFMVTVFTGCSNNNLYTNKTTVENSVSTQTQAPEQAGQSEQTQSSDSSPAAETGNSQTAPATDTKGIDVIDYTKVKPNESGQIMVVMFHNFVESYPKGNNEYTTTFDEFEKLLPELYEKKYRLISLTDMLNNNINVPAGCIPIVFTFDDGTSGQFNMIEKDGKLAVNPRSAVGIMEEFYKKHPDFGLQGTFYVNLGVKTFQGSGNMTDRMNYLIEKGFEIGNHTKTHVSLPQVKTVQKMLEEVGGNQVLMNEIVPGYSFNSFSLPFGNASKDLKEYVIKGNYQGVDYKHSAVVLVGANPAPSPVSPKFDPLALPRVRSTGQKKVECDLAWWLDTLGKGSSQYVSDGNPETVTVPKDKQKNVDMSRLNGKQLVTY